MAVTVVTAEEDRGAEVLVNLEPELRTLARNS
jgi:hypothetical protein